MTTRWINGRPEQRTEAQARSYQEMLKGKLRKLYRAGKTIRNDRETARLYDRIHGENLEEHFHGDKS